MIVRILSRGRSFQGLADYLTHDAEAETDARVGWTHTHNLAHDEVASAVDEMLWTARDAELLKMEAGIRAGGRETENPVKHLSLNWAPGEEPTREHMIESAEDFLRHMKWDEHQALFVAHEDKEYRHVHLMLNAVHPETGLKLDDNFEYRRAQAWALDYEREHGLHCENRLKDVREREEAPTRPAWMAFKGAERNFENDEKIRSEQQPEIENIPENSGDISKQEWAALKAIQREERASFFADGKLAFKEMRSDIFREVRDEFRDRWADYYDAAKYGVDADALKELKAGLVAEQAAVLEQRRDEACSALRETRETLYRGLLDGQKDMRLDLRERQAAGFESLDLIDNFRVDRSQYTIEPTLTERVPGEMRIETAGSSDSIVFTKPDTRGEFRSGAAISAGLADGAFTVAGELFDFLAGGDTPRPAPSRSVTAAGGPDPIAAAADEAVRRAARDAELEEMRRKSDQWQRAQQ